MAKCYYVYMGKHKYNIYEDILIFGWKIYWPFIYKCFIIFLCMSTKNHLSKHFLIIFRYYVLYYGKIYIWILDTNISFNSWLTLQN